MNTELNKKIFFYFLYFYISIVLTIAHANYVEQGITFQSRYSDHVQVITGIARKPYNTRILQAITVELFTRAISNIINFEKNYGLFKKTFEFAYSIIYFIGLFFMFVFFEKILVFFGDIFIARYLVIFLAALYAFVFKQIYNSTSELELAFFSISFYCIMKNVKFFSLIVLLLLATLNRNTSIFIILFYILWNFRNINDLFSKDTQKSRLNFILNIFGLSAIWICIMIILSQLFQGGGWDTTPLEHLKHNLFSSSAFDVWFKTLIILWPVIVSVINEWNTVDSKYRVLVIGWGIPYFLLYLLMARCNEVRIWLPFYLVCAPYLMAFFGRMLKQVPPKLM
ncbi:MAG: hypothetical protein NT145_07415 [Elusimicrobia bacterium]|nr:hypothetical protein [Elusimicrobiota bacterium]